MSPVYNPLTATATLTVLKNGTTVGARPAINFIEGTNVTETIADNAGTVAVDATIAATSGSAITGAMPTGTLSTVGESCVASDSNTYMGGHWNSIGTYAPVASRALYVPVQVAETITVYRMAWTNGATVAGNIDVGIYDESFSRLVSIGSTAQAGVSTMQVVDIADTVLVAGTYFLAFVRDDITATFARSSASDATVLELSGVQHMAAGFPLPATATGLSAPNTSVLIAVYADFISGTVF